MVSDETILRVAHGAILAARRRAKDRGLTDEEIDRESDDEDSQYWDDIREILGSKPRSPDVTH
jgi:hypothetical protein